MTVRDPVDVPENDPETDEGGIRLFKHAPPGIVFDHIGKSISSDSVSSLIGHLLSLCCM